VLAAAALAFGALWLLRASGAEGVSEERKICKTRD